MSRRDKRKRESARRGPRRPVRRGSIVTIVQYGPDDKTVTKVVAAYYGVPGGAQIEMRKWVATGLTTSLKFREELAAFVDRWRPDRVVFSLGVMGCPHEEGPDYPRGEVCSVCPFWATHDRFETANPVVLDPRMIQLDNPWPWRAPE